MRLLIIALAAAGSCGYAQTLINLQNQSKAVDFANSNSTRPVKTGTVLPAVCSAGELYFKRDAAPGQNLYGCTSTNVWMPLASGGGTGGSGIVTMATGSGSPSVACAGPSATGLSLYTDTTAKDVWACVSTDTWKKILSTTDSGSYVLTGAIGAKPGTPAAGFISYWFDDAGKVPKAINSDGMVVSMVRASVASGTVYAGGYEVGAEDAASALTTADLTNHAFSVNDGNPKTLTEASCISDAGSQVVTVKIGTATLFSITCVPPASYSRGTTNGSTGFINAAGMSSTAVAAGSVLDLSGTANTTTKDIKLHIYGTVN